MCQRLNLYNAHQQKEVYGMIMIFVWDHQHDGGQRKQVK